MARLHVGGAMSVNATMVLPCRHLCPPAFRNRKNRVCPGFLGMAESGSDPEFRIPRMPASASYSDPDRSPIFERGALGVLLALVVWAPFPLGSNRTWAWAILVAGLCGAALLWLIGWVRGEVRAYGVLRQSWPAFVALGLWLAYLGLFLIPLPAAWVQVLSPEAARIHALGAPYAADGGARAWLSLDPHASLLYWLRSCGYAIAFFLAIVLCRHRMRVQVLAYTIVLSGLVQAVYGGMLHLSAVDLTLFGERIEHGTQASGGFVNRNHLAGFLEMTLAVGIGLMIANLEDSAPRSWRRFARDIAQVILSPKAPLRIFLVVMVVALVMTRSRMGNTAFFASLIVAGSVALVLSRHATRSTVILIASLIVVDIFIVGAWFGVEKTVQRIEQTTRRDVEERVEPGAYALDLARDYPVFGSGPGTFYSAFTRYRGEDILAFYDHAHNDYVQFFTDTGAIGVALAGSFALMALVCAVLAQARRRDRLARGIAFGVVMGTCSIAIHSTVDFNLQIPANAFTFTLLLALGWVSLHLDRKNRSPEKSGT